MNTQIQLDRVRVASPCNARWEDMAGDDRSRFCGQCQKSVFNFSAMTRAEVETLIREKEGRLCARFYQRPDGRMLTADCPTGARRRWNLPARWSGTAFAALTFLLSGCSSRRKPEVMGKIAAPPPLMGDVCMPQTLPTNSPHLQGEIYIAPKSTLPSPSTSPSQK